MLLIEHDDFCILNTDRFSLLVEFLLNLIYPQMAIITVGSNFNVEYFQKDY